MKLAEIEGYSGYFVGDNGTVYCNLGKGNRRDTESKARVDLYPLKSRPGKTEYMRVYMRRDVDNKRRDEYVHRLVAKYFVPNPEGKTVVNHVNCDRSDNRTINLEWVTTKENLQHDEKVGHLLRDKETGRMMRGDY